ncbi:transmembrane protein 267 [Stigmatopora argus]
MQQGFFPKLKSSSPSPVPLSSAAAETEKARALLRTFSAASLLASAGLGAFCVAADHVLRLPALQRHPWPRALLDNAAHAAVGLWSWALVIGLRKRSDLYQALLAGFLAAAVDLDHFFAAGSLSLQAAVSLPGRPPLHCSTLIPVLCLSLRFFMWLARLKDAWCSLPWLLFVAMATHHLRDAVRRGLWLCPLGHAPPLPYWLYLGTATTLPHLCSVLMYLSGARDVLSSKHGVAIDV